MIEVASWGDWHPRCKQGHMLVAFRNVPDNGVRRYYLLPKEDYDRGKAEGMVIDPKITIYEEVKL